AGPEGSRQEGAEDALQDAGAHRGQSVDRGSGPCRRRFRRGHFRGERCRNDRLNPCRHGQACRPRPGILQATAHLALPAVAVRDTRRFECLYGTPALSRRPPESELATPVVAILYMIVTY